MDSLARSQMQNRPYREKTDDELIAISEAGDNDAFGELACRYRPMAFKAAFFMLRSEPDAEDQVQNALCKAYQHIGRFQRKSKFSTWLARIVVNECLMQLRRRRRAALIPIHGIGEEAAAFELRDERRSHDLELQDAEDVKLLQQQIRRIPPILRNVFLLRDIQQKPMQDVAKELGISVNAAKSRLLRARVELRKRLQ